MLPALVDDSGYDARGSRIFLPARTFGTPPPHGRRARAGGCFGGTGYYSAGAIAGLAEDADYALEYFSFMRRHATAPRHYAAMAGRAFTIHRPRATFIFFMLAVARMIFRQRADKDRYN